MNNELKENIETLVCISKLEDNWDGQGAKQFNKEFIVFLSKIIINLSVQPDIFPLQDGSVVFEFGNVSSNYLEFTFYKDKNMRIYKKDWYGNRENNYTTYDFNLLLEQIEWFLEKQKGLI